LRAVVRSAHLDLAALPPQTVCGWREPERLASWRRRAQRWPLSARSAGDLPAVLGGELGGARAHCVACGRAAAARLGESVAEISIWLIHRRRCVAHQLSSQRRALGRNLPEEESAERAGRVQRVRCGARRAVAGLGRWSAAARGAL